MARRNSAQSHLAQKHLNVGKIHNVQKDVSRWLAFWAVSQCPVAVINALCEGFYKRSFPNRYSVAKKIIAKFVGY